MDRPNSATVRVGRCVIEQHPPLMEDHGSLGVFGDQGHVMGDDQHRVPRPMQLVGDLHDLMAALVILTSGRFVQDNSLGPHGQHRSDYHLGPLPLGQGRWKLAAERFQARGSYRVLHSPPNFLFVQFQVPRPKGDFFLHRLGKELAVRVLEDKADVGC